jgi:hypothetical protein
MKSLLLIAVLSLLIFSSCSVNRKSISSAPLNATVNFTMDDLEYLGEIQGTATQNYVLGIPYGRTNYNYGRVLNQFMGMPVQTIQRRVISQALYTAMSQKGNADFILPLSSETKTDFLFLGRKETVTVKAKAFRIKSK